MDGHVDTNPPLSSSFVGGKEKPGSGQIFWLNTVHLTKPEISAMMATSPFADLAVSWFCLGGSLPALLLLTEENNATLHDYLADLLKLVKEFSAFAQQNQGTQQQFAAPMTATQQQQQQDSTSRSAGAGPDASIVSRANGTSSSTSSSSTHKKLSRFFKSRSSKENSISGNINWISSSSSSDGADSAAISIISSNNGLMISSTNNSSSGSNDVAAAVNSSSSGSRSRKSSSAGEFSLLTVMHLPFVPDVHETFVSLCDIWIAAYRHVLTFSSGGTAADLEALLSLDEWLKTELVSPVIQKVDMLSKTLVYEESNKLDGLLIHSK